MDLKYIGAHILKISAILLFILAGSLIKEHLQALTNTQQAFFSSLFAVLFLSTCLTLQNSFFQKYRTDRSVILQQRYSGQKKLYCIRILASVSAKWLWLEAIRFLSLNEAVAILYLVPLFSIFLSISWVGEKLSLHWILPTLCAVVGTAIIIFLSRNDLGHGNTKGYLAAIASAFLYGLYNVICKIQTDKKEHYLTQAIITFTGSTLVLIPFTFFYWNEINISSLNVAAIVGVLSATSVVFNFLAYKNATVSELAVHDYLRIVFSIILVYYTKGQLPDTTFCVGIFLIILGNLGLFCRPQKFNNLN